MNSRHSLLFLILLVPHSYYYSYITFRLLSMKTGDLAAILLKQRTRYSTTRSSRQDNSGGKGCLEDRDVIKASIVTDTLNSMDHTTLDKDVRHRIGQVDRNGSFSRGIKTSRDSTSDEKSNDVDRDNSTYGDGFIDYMKKSFESSLAHELRQIDGPILQVKLYRDEYTKLVDAAIDGQSSSNAVLVYIDGEMTSDGNIQEYNCSKMHRFYETDDLKQFYSRQECSIVMCVTINASVSPYYYLNLLKGLMDIIHEDKKLLFVFNNHLRVRTTDIIDCVNSILSLALVGKNVIVPTSFGTINGITHCQNEVYASDAGILFDGYNNYSCGNLDADVADQQGKTIRINKFNEVNVEMIFDEKQNVTSRG